MSLTLTFEIPSCAGFNRQFSSVGITAEGTRRKRLCFLLAHSVPMLWRLGGAGYARQFLGRSSGRITREGIEGGKSIDIETKSAGNKSLWVCTRYSRAANDKLEEQ
jgi:hypothetical protein